MCLRSIQSGRLGGADRIVNNWSSIFDPDYGDADADYYADGADGFARRKSSTPTGELARGPSLGAAAAAGSLFSTPVVRWRLS